MATSLCLEGAMRAVVVAVLRSPHDIMHGFCPGSTDGEDGEDAGHHRHRDNNTASISGPHQSLSIRRERLNAAHPSVFHFLSRIFSFLCIGSNANTGTGSRFQLPVLLLFRC
jgi:hypothetical protein